MSDRRVQFRRSLILNRIAPLALLLLLGGGPNLNGSYKITYVGALSGDGNAAVGANNVNINGKVTDLAGNSGNLVASNLDLANGRFHGTGNFAGGTIAVTGRVEAPDGQTLKVARLSCIITLANGTHAKAIGFR